MDETIRTSPCLSHKIIFHIGPHPWLVSGLLSSHTYGTYCNVYTVQCNVSTTTDSNLFVCLSTSAKPKQMLSRIKYSTENHQYKTLKF